MMEKNIQMSFVAWLTYFIQTEEFDRTLPGCMGRDGWIPDPPYRLRMIDNAKRCRDRLESSLLGIPTWEVNEGRKAAEIYRDLDEMKKVRDATISHLNQ